MGLSLNYVSPAITLGPANDDPDPNTGGGPVLDRIFNAGRRTEGGSETTGVLAAFDFTVATDKVDLTFWFQDEKSGKWFKSNTITAVGDKEAVELIGFRSADHFFQLTNHVGTGDVVIRAEPTN